MARPVCQRTRRTSGAQSITVAAVVPPNAGMWHVACGRPLRSTQGDGRSTAEGTMFSGNEWVILILLVGVVAVPSLIIAAIVLGTRGRGSTTTHAAPGPMPTRSSRPRLPAGSRTRSVGTNSGTGTARPGPMPWCRTASPEPTRSDSHSAGAPRSTKPTSRLHLGHASMFGRERSCAGDHPDDSPALVRLHWKPRIPRRSRGFARWAYTDLNRGPLPCRGSALAN